MIRKFAVSITSSMLLAAGVAGCATEEGVASDSQEVLWCYQVPVETALEGEAAEAIDRLKSTSDQWSGIYCGAQRPATAIGDAFLPIYVDREARTLELEGGFDAASEGIIVRITGLEPGVWTEHKKVYNLSDAPWQGWLVTMGSAELVLPESVSTDVDAWVSVDDEYTHALYPTSYGASVNGNRNAVFFGESAEPASGAGQAVMPGDYIEKVWSYTVIAEDGKPTGDARMCHNRSI